MKRVLSIIFVLVILNLSAVPTANLSSINIQDFDEVDSVARLAEEYSDALLALNMTTIVGTGGSEYENAMNLIAASTLAIRRGESTEARSLVVPDSLELDIETPLDEWLTFLGGSTEELLFIGDVDQADYQDVIDGTGFVHSINESNFFDTASSIASQYFGTSDTVVVTYANSSPDMFSEITTLYNEEGNLSAPTTTATGYSTSSSNNWERKVSITRGGGGIVAWTTGSSSVLNYQLAQLGISYGGKYYGLDYPWYGNHKMAYPYFEGFGTQWFFNFIDLYPYSRTASFTLYVSTLDIQRYPFTIGDEEIAQVELSLTSSTNSTPIGLYVLDPDGGLILDANRFALLESEMESTTIEATLAYPGPGNYTAYVTTPSASGASYDIEIVKKVFNPDFIESQIASTNGLSIASLQDSPLLFSDGEGLCASVISALSKIRPDDIIVVDPSNKFTSATRNSLSTFAPNVEYVIGLEGMQEFISDEIGSVRNSGNVTIFDPNGGYFAAAGLSAAARMGLAIPICYQGSEMVTKARIPEQFAWHGDYTVPFIGGFHYYDLWTSTLHLSTLHPEYDLVYDVYLAFEDWLNRTSGIISPESLILIAPYNEQGNTVPPTFDRSIIGDCRVGRYPSRIAESSFNQIMQSMLRVPLLSTLVHPKAVDSHVAYSHGMAVYTNSLSVSNVYSSNTFPTLMSSSGIPSVRESGPSTPSLVANETILWILSSHGIAGDMLYGDDGRIALMNVDCYRGYEAGRTPDSPDSDGDELINPPSDYLLDLNMTSFINGSDLHGLVSYIDTCEVGASYSPALLLESGAEAVVACWVDSFFGPSDLLEETTMQGYAQNNLTLSDALVAGFLINSHVYSMNYEGREVYNYNIIGATTNQFVVFGNPDVRLYDYMVTPPRVVSRITADVPSSMSTTLGYSMSFNITMLNHFGLPIDLEEMEYSVLTPESSLLHYGISHCDEEGTAEINVAFAEDLDSGRYTIIISSPYGIETYKIAVDVQLPTPLQMAVESAPGWIANISLGLLDHKGEIMTAERFEAEVRNPYGVIYYSSSICCDNGFTSQLEVIFNVTAVTGIYTVEFWRVGDVHSCEILINVHDNEIYGSAVLDASIGETVNVIFGLSSIGGSILDTEIYEYFLSSPNNVTLITGATELVDERTASVDLVFPFDAETGVYEFYFSIPGSGVFNPILINVYDLHVSNGQSYSIVLAGTFEIDVGMEDFRGLPVTIDALNYVLYSPSADIVMEGTITDVVQGTKLSINLPVYLPVGSYNLELNLPGTDRNYNLTINARTPVLEAEYFIPNRPQVGVWQIYVSITNSEDFSLDAQLTVLVNSLTIVDQLIEINPGGNPFSFYVDMVDFAIFDPGRAQITVLLNYGQLVDSQTTFPLTSSWQVTTFVSVVPILLAIVPIMEMYRRKVYKKLNRITMAKEMEESEGRGLVSAFATYVDLEMPQSATRAALKNDLPEDMFENLKAMGDSTFTFLRIEATELEKSADYRNAAKIYGMLGRQKDQIRNQLLSFQEDKDMDALLQLAHDIMEKGNFDDIVNVIVQMVNANEFDNATILLTETDEFREQIANSAKPSPDGLNAFREIISRLEPGSLFYNYSAELGLWETIVETILEASTAKAMANRTNEIDAKYRLEVAKRVVTRLIDKKVHRKAITYVTYTDLTDEERGIIIQEVGSTIISNPENTAAQKVLIGFKSLSDVANEQVDEFMMVIQTLTDSGEIQTKDSNALLRAASLCRNNELACNLLDRALETELEGKAPTALDLEQLADLTHRIREYGYTAKEEVKDTFKSHLETIERDLIEEIINEAKRSILAISFDPEALLAQGRYMENLTQILVGISIRDPTSSITALLRAASMRSVNEISQLTQRLLVSPSILRFAERISKDHLKMQRIARRAVKYIPTQTGYRQIVDNDLANRLVMEEAVQDWNQKVYNLWAAANTRAAIQIADESMLMAISQEEKIDIITTKIADFANIPFVQSGKTVEQIFTSLVQHANLTSEQQHAIIDNSQLSQPKKRQFMSLVE